MLPNFINLLIPTPVTSNPSLFTWFSEDIYVLLIRLGINLAFLTIIIRFLYYPKTKRKHYLFC